MGVIDASKQKGMTVRLALGQPACLHWTEEGRPENLQRLSYSQVSFTWNDNRLFDGNLLMQEPSVEEDSEGVTFDAYDKWEWLNNHVFTKSDTSKIHYNDKDQGDTMKTCEEIMTEILDQAVADGWGCTYGDLSSMTLTPPRLNFFGTNYGEAIYQVLYMQADHNAYIENSTKVFTLVNFNTLDEKSVYLGKLNTAVGTLDGSNFNVKSANLSLNLSGCKTKAILEGGNTFNQVTETLTFDKEESDNRYFNAAHANWLSTLLNSSGVFTQDPPTVTIQVETQYDGGAWSEVEWRLNSTINPKTGVIKVQNLVHQQLVWVNGGGTSTVLVNYRAKSVVVTYAYEGDPIFKTYTADDSTAHQFGYDADLYVNEQGMRQVDIDGVTVRDDLDQMDDMVNLLLTTMKDEKLEGTVVLDMGEKVTADVLWKQGQKVKIEYSINDVWTDRFARINNIEYRFDTREVTLGLTSDKLPFGGSAYEQRVRQAISEKANQESTESWVQGSVATQFPDWGMGGNEEEIGLADHVHSTDDNMGGPLDEVETKVYLEGALETSALGMIKWGTYKTCIVTADNGDGTYSFKEYLNETQTYSNVANPGGSATGGDFNVDDIALLIEDHSRNVIIASGSGGGISFRIVKITADNSNGTYNIEEYQNASFAWNNIPALNDSGSGGYYAVDDYVIMSNSFDGDKKLVDLTGGTGVHLESIPASPENGDMWLV